jgi:hypothetical protein
MTTPPPDRPAVDPEVLRLLLGGVRPPQVQQDLAVAVAELTRHQTVEMP